MIDLKNNIATRNGRQIIEKGFAGFKMVGAGIHLRPKLPASGDSLCTQLVVRGNRLTVLMTHEALKLEAETEDPGTLFVWVGDERLELKPGTRVRLEMED